MVVEFLNHFIIIKGMTLLPKNLIYNKDITFF